MWLSQYCFRWFKIVFLYLLIKMNQHVNFYKNLRPGPKLPISFPCSKTYVLVLKHSRRLSKIKKTLICFCRSLILLKLNWNLYKEIFAFLVSNLIRHLYWAQFRLNCISWYNCPNCTKQAPILSPKALRCFWPWWVYFKESNPHQWNNLNQRIQAYLLENIEIVNVGSS